MSVEYYLVKGGLDTLEGRYIARVDTSEPLQVDDMLRLMHRYNNTVSEEEAKGVIIVFQKTVEHYLLEGNSVDTGLVIVSPSVAGVFESEEDTFDESRHKIRVNARVKSDFVRAFRVEARTRMVEAPDGSPRPLSVLDMASGRSDGLVTLGGHVRLTGRRLRYLPENADAGVRNARRHPAGPLSA